MGGKRGSAKTRLCAAMMVIIVAVVSACRTGAGPYVSAGAGVTVLAKGGNSEVGVAVDVEAGGKITENWAVGGALTWGMTDFDRAGEYADRGNRIGRAVTRGYRNVTRWAKGCKEANEAACAVGAFFAYIGLAFGYALAGAMYVGTPVAATSYFGGSAIGSYRIGKDNIGGHVDFGISATQLFLPGEPKGASWAGGPLIGAGFHIHGLELSARYTILPPSLHREGPRVISIGLFTLGFTL
jgi:hypothetical protein